MAWERLEGGIIIALRRVVVAYRAQIPDYESRAAALGLKDIPSSENKAAEVIE